MSPVEREARLELLLAHAAWIRSLARELVLDPDLAEEIEQRTFVAALSHSPRSGVPFSSWLSSVVRNFARQHHRSKDRRATHEERAARPEALPSTDDVVERAAVQRALVEAVMELDEPVRSTVLLRFYDGLPPRDVARRMDVPVETVRARTARGLALLRERLDRTHGGRRAVWLGALLPFAQGSGSPLRWAGMGIMNTKWKVAAALAVVLGLAAVAWKSDASASGAETTEETTANRERESRQASGSSGSNTNSARDDTRASAARGTGEAPPATPARLVRGKVIDADGRALSAIRVGVGEKADTGAKETLATTDAAGTYEFPAQAGQVHVLDCEPNWTTVLAGKDGGRASEKEQIVVLARPRLLDATVVDESGAPVAMARVEVDVAPAFRTRFAEILDGSMSLERRALSGPDGRFRFDELPDLADARVAIHHDAFLPFEARLVDLAPRTVITLSKPSASAEGIVRGRVVDPAGSPVVDARVAFGVDTRATDERGEFAFLLDDPGSMSRRFGVAADELVALAPGHQIATFTPPVRDGKPEWPAFVVLQLGAQPLTLSGHVFDTKGAPLPGARVWIMDARFFGGDERGPLLVENLLAEGAPRGWRFAETDAEGAFELDGLLDSEYHVEAMDPTTLLRAQEGPFRAGASNVKLSMPKDALHPRVAGRVVSRHGEPIAGVRVFPMCDAFRTRAKERILSTNHAALDGVVTGADGTFELSNVPRSLVYLRLQGDDVLPLEYCRHGSGDDRFRGEEMSRLPAEAITQLEIVVELRCHVQIVLADPTLADAVEIHDSKLRPVELNVYDGGRRDTRERFELFDGRSPALAVSDAGTTVVLYKDGKEIARTPIALAPGPLREVRF